MNKKLILVVPVVALGVLTGCRSSHSAAVASGSAGAHAVATSSAAAEGKAIVRACTPKSPLAQAQWLRYMAAGKHSSNALKGKETRQAFASCAGIPPAKTKAFENQILTDAEAAAKSAASPNVTVKQAAEKYMGTTLPEDVVKARG